MLWVAGAVGVIELASRQPRRGVGALEPAVTALAGSEPLALVLVPAAEALIGLGELDRAEALLDGLTREAQQAERHRCRALLLAARGDLRPRPPRPSSRWSASSAARARPHAARAGPDRPPPQAEEGRRASRSRRRCRCSRPPARSAGRSRRATTSRGSAASARPT
jgi:hypothetical protein